ncbi:hypothetical protein ACFPT7_03310 [Acidicapsa dinghuensis]|uniref:Uncharacterized protein n=1 Tax=Acidicapsa dinghuensis TaxID=2218256 RepID=A0ABW1EAF2_9BACT|nr:hypothetical protein [Acidicapsa dinghuensis]
MHWNIQQILWALVLASHLVLMIVLLGRERIRRFPWFTAYIVLSAVRLIADHLLHGKLTTVAFYWQSYTGSILEAILGVLVLIELCRHVFSSGRTGKILKGKGWIGGILVTVPIALAVAALWNMGITWTAMKSDPEHLPLYIDLYVALKSQLFIAALTVEVGVFLQFFGRRFGAKWRSHDRQIVLGLSTMSIALLAVQATTDIIKHHVHLTSRDQYEHIVRIFENLDNARFAVWLLALIWWIVWLWRDDPDAPPAAEMADVPVLVGPPSLDVRLQEPDEPVTHD